jgi:hypothetical protein
MVAQELKNVEICENNEGRHPAEQEDDGERNEDEKGEEQLEGESLFMDEEEDHDGGSEERRRRMVEIAEEEGSDEEVHKSLAWATKRPKEKDAPNREHQRRGWMVSRRTWR